MSAERGVAGLSPLPYRGRGQGEGAALQLELHQKPLTSMLSPLRKGRGEPARSARETRVGQPSDWLTI
jgi:hypothetical protein